MLSPRGVEGGGGGEKKSAELFNPVALSRKTSATSDLGQLWHDAQLCVCVPLCFEHLAPSVPPHSSSLHGLVLADAHTQIGFAAASCGSSLSLSLSTRHCFFSLSLHFLSWAVNSLPHPPAQLCSSVGVLRFDSWSSPPDESITHKFTF